MSGYIEYIKDPAIRAYLEHIRLLNKQYMSICYKCDSSSIGIIAEGYSIYPACKLHISISDTLRENAEILERLGSDYDDNGIPYWDN